MTVPSSFDIVDNPNYVTEGKDKKYKLFCHAKYIFLLDFPHISNLNIFLKIWQQYLIFTSLVPKSNFTITRPRTASLNWTIFFILKIVQSTEEMFYRTLSKIQLIFIYILRSVKELAVIDSKKLAFGPPILYH